MRRILDEYISHKDNTKLLISGLGVFPLSERVDNLIDFGIQEHNMVNVACGLSKLNTNVYIYSVSGFCIHRGYEQIKYNLAAKGKGAIIMTGGAGFCYGNTGYGHYVIDDFAIMATIPNIKMYAPSDRKEFLTILNLHHGTNDLVYIRLGIDDFPEVNALNPYNVILNSRKPILITTGWLSNYHYRHSSDKYNIVHIPEIKKLSNFNLTNMHLYRDIVVIEDHIKFGGLTTYIPNIKLKKHTCIPLEIINESFKTKEEFWDNYNLTDKRE